MGAGVIYILTDLNCEACENGDPTDGHDGGVSACVRAIGERSHVDIAAALLCPNCPNQGWYAMPNHQTEEIEQVQCEFCNTEPNSVFNIAQGGMYSRGADGAEHVNSHLKENNHVSYIS